MDSRKKIGSRLVAIDWFPGKLTGPGFFDIIISHIHEVAAFNVDCPSHIREGNTEDKRNHDFKSGDIGAFPLLDLSPPALVHSVRLLGTAPDLYPDLDGSLPQGYGH